MSKKQLEIIYKPIDDLRPNDRNPRLNDPAVQKVVASIQEFGWTAPILIDRSNNIIAGHTRWKAAHVLNLRTVPTITLTLTGKKAEQYMIADNKLSEIAQWDEALLADLIIEFRDLGMNIEVMGYENDEILNILGEKAYNTGLVPEDQAPEPPRKPKTKNGDIYTLGSHRLLCGDCTSQNAVQTLMGDAQADLCFTDPPYNVKYTGKKATRQRGKHIHAA